MHPCVTEQRSLAQRTGIEGAHDPWLDVGDLSRVAPPTQSPSARPCRLALNHALGLGADGEAARRMAIYAVEAESVVGERVAP